MSTAPDLVIDVVDGIFPARPGPDGTAGEITRHYVLIDYAARWTAGEPVAGDDASDAAFVPLARIDRLGLWSETVRVIRLAADLVGV